MYGHAKFVERLTKPGFSVEGATVDVEEPERVDPSRGRLAGSMGAIPSKGVVRRITVVCGDKEEGGYAG